MPGQGDRLLEHGELPGLIDPDGPLIVGLLYLVHLLEEGDQLVKSLQRHWIPRVEPIHGSIPYTGVPPEYMSMLTNANRALVRWVGNAAVCHPEPSEQTPTHITARQRQANENEIITSHYRLCVDAHTIRSHPNVGGSSYCVIGVEPYPLTLRALVAASHHLRTKKNVVISSPNMIYHGSGNVLGVEMVQQQPAGDYPIQQARDLLHDLTSPEFTAGSCELPQFNCFVLSRAVTNQEARKLGIRLDLPSFTPLSDEHCAALNTPEGTAVLDWGIDGIFAGDLVVPVPQPASWAEIIRQPQPEPLRLPFSNHSWSAHFRRVDTAGGPYAAALS